MKPGRSIAQWIRKIFHFLSHRSVAVAVSLVVQILVLVAVLYFFLDYFVYFYAICLLSSILVVIGLVNGKSNPAYKIIWIMLIMAMPIFGGIFYLMFGGNTLRKSTRKKMSRMQGLMQLALPQTDALEQLREESLDAFNQSNYLLRYAVAPPWENTSVEYLPLGECKWERMLVELEKAEHFIFLEYFIIEEGKMWDSILEILVRKVKQGVDVRLIYDDVGCLFTLPEGYYRKMESLGIQCRAFNPFIPVLSARLNNRDHRKICVIDGYIGFTGGINLADEYINAYPKHGHWKDVAVMLQGDAVRNLTVMFLSVWDIICGIDEDWSQFYPQKYLPQPVATDGYVQPYSDNPIDGEAVGETVYLNLITKAERYVYISTPYLIIDNEMIVALCNAAKAGVDVRILLPHIADKWYVHALSRAYYETLLEYGVKIYEYTPGFVHAKMFVVDDIYGTVGTVNLDYRSLYLHFECGTWMYRCRCIGQMKQDYLETLTRSEEVTLQYCRQIPWYLRLVRSLLRLVAPLM